MLCNYTRYVQWCRVFSAVQFFISDKFFTQELLGGRHEDEVIAVDLNEEHVLSGSGDPGYYARRPLDASVRLWRRSDGAALGCFEGHADSVRCVALFKTQGLMQFALSGSLDCHMILWALKNGSVESASHLCGPCRCMSILCEDVDAFGTARARILAGSGEGVAELALTVRQGVATVTQLKFVSAYVDVSSLSYFLGPIWRQEIEQGSWPKSFLGASLKVAVGSVDGQFALLQGGTCRAVHELFKSRHGNHDVVSIATWLQGFMAVSGASQIQLALFAPVFFSNSIKSCIASTTS